MTKQQYVFIIPLLFISCALLSCQSTKTPLQISEHFWLGIKTKNVALVKKYSLVNSIDDKEDINQFENITAITFGKIIIDGDAAEIETSVTLSDNGNDENVSLNTYLENNNDAWKVNYRKTILQLVAKQKVAEVFEDIQEMTEEIAAQLEESVEEIKEKVVPEIKSKIEQKVEQVEKEFLDKLPEIKNMFDEFLHKLEKSLDELMPPSEEEAKTVET